MAEEKKIFSQHELNEKVAVVIGTRPGIVMFAPIFKALRELNIPHVTIHTGQHYSPNMDTQFFHDLDMHEPDYKLSGVSESPTHGGQTAKMLEGIEAILMKERPKLVLVGGDANTNVAGALAARKLRIAVGHVEAGERSYDWSMPEEHNRRIIDHISDYLFTTGEKGKEQLEKECVMGKIFVTGNTIVDASLQNLDVAKKKSYILKTLELEPQQYAILTTHREENVDIKDKLYNSLLGVSRASAELRLPVIFPVHPRTRKRLIEFDLLGWAEQLDNIKIIDAVGYLDFTQLCANAAVIFTDSGGVQQEACIHNVPAVTLRENTEWGETIEIGANRLAGTDIDNIIEKAKEAINSKTGWKIPFGTGDAAKKIALIVKEG